MIIRLNKIRDLFKVKLYTIHSYPKWEYKIKNVSEV